MGLGDDVEISSDLHPFLAFLGVAALMFTLVVLQDRHLNKKAS
jgi:hypothetical protein